VTSHSRVAGAPLLSEVVTGEEGRAVTLNSVPSESPPTGQSSSTTLGHLAAHSTCWPTAHNLPVGSAARRGARPGSFSPWPPTDEWLSLHRALRSGSVGALDHILEELEARHRGRRALSGACETLSGHTPVTMCGCCRRGLVPASPTMFAPGVPHRCRTPAGTGFITTWSHRLRVQAS
jgi:hypothetical protein